MIALVAVSVCGALRVDGVEATDGVAAFLVTTNARFDAAQEGRRHVVIARGQHHGAGVMTPGLLLFALIEPQREVAVSLLLVQRGQFGIGHQGGGHHALQLLGVEGVVDLVDQLEIDALVEALLGRQQGVALLTRQGVEVIDVIRRGHLQRQLAVFQREEARRARDPVELVAVLVDLAQQVEIDLGGALAGADDGDGRLGGQFLLARQIVGVVAHAAARDRHHVTHGIGGFRQVGLGAGAQHQLACAIGEGFAGAGASAAHDIDVADMLDILDVVIEAQAAQLARRPLAVLVVLTTQQEEVFADVEVVELVMQFQIVEEAEVAGRVGQRDHVRHEGRLHAGIFQQHARVPVERGLALEEDALDVFQRLAQAGKAEVEGADADGNEVQHIITRFQSVCDVRVRGVMHDGFPWLLWCDCDGWRPECRPGGRHGSVGR